MQVWMRAAGTAQAVGKRRDFLQAQMLSRARTAGIARCASWQGGGGLNCHGYIVGSSRAVSLARVLRRWKCHVMQLCSLWIVRNPSPDPAEATAKSAAENSSFRSATGTS
jgi:hypothetical protein